MSLDTVTLATDVLVVGTGAAGLPAALAAASAGAGVILADRSLIGRSGATITAQMTVAIAHTLYIISRPIHNISVSSCLLHRSSIGMAARCH